MGRKEESPLLLVLCLLLRVSPGEFFFHVASPRVGTEITSESASVGGSKFTRCKLISVVEALLHKTDREREREVRYVEVPLSLSSCHFRPSYPPLLGHAGVEGRYQAALANFLQCRGVPDWIGSRYLRWWMRVFHVRHHGGEGGGGVWRLHLWNGTRSNPAPVLEDRSCDPSLNLFSPLSYLPLLFSASR